MAKDHSGTISRICDALIDGDLGKASQIACNEYPFNKVPATKRNYTELQSTRLFVRDGFIDRYSGSRLVFPATIRLLSKLLPDEFPRHLNWKMSECHMAYWELFPTVDHIVPIARGGADREENWATTSMIRNSAKSNWTLEDLGWQLFPPGKVEHWDGLMNWFLRYVESDSSLLEDNYLMRWQKAALSALDCKSRIHVP